jgi:hypothetical protein
VVIVISLLCFAAGGLTGLVLAAVLGARVAADYRERLRRQIKEEALERDYGTWDSPVRAGFKPAPTPKTEPKTENRPL